MGSGKRGGGRKASLRRRMNSQRVFPFPSLASARFATHLAEGERERERASRSAAEAFVRSPPLYTTPKLILFSGRSGAISQRVMETSNSSPAVGGGIREISDFREQKSGGGGGKRWREGGKEKSLQ